MPPELPGIGQVDVNPDGTLHLHYTTTDGMFDGEIVRPTVEYSFNTNDLHTFINDRILTDRITIDPAVATIPDTTIYTTDCSGNVWISPNEERIKEIVRETVKELLEQEGYIIGRIPNEISDPSIS